MNAQAQDPESIEEVSDLGLPILSGDITVYYSETYAERSAYLKEILETANRYFKQPDIMGVELDLGLAVPDLEDWARWTRIPYGMAHIQLGEKSAVIMPATTDNWLVNGLLENKERVSEETIQCLKKLGFSLEQTNLTYAELIAFHELGHIYSEAYDVWPTQNWLSEFTATYLAYAFLKETRPKLAQLWRTFSESMIETRDHGHTTLADFEDLYIKMG